MMRIVLAAVTVTAAMSFEARPARAVEIPWCALIAIGEDAAYDDCRYRSFEECRSSEVTGNRSFCNQNPRWEGGKTSTGVKKARNNSNAKRD